MSELRVERVSPWMVEIPRTGAMRVPGRVFVSKELMQTQKADEALRQVANVAELPGIVEASLAMPDFHWGYGFPIGGVAAFDPDAGGVVSPGGIGYDINCGVRLLRTDLTREEVQPRVDALARGLFEAIPAGVGSSGAIPKLGRDDLRRILVEGASWAVERGFGRPEDLESIEDGGRLEGADPSAVSDRALSRGLPQVGTLGSGNHFLEVQVVEEVYRPEVAEKLGLAAGGVCIAIHSGSRGLGYQVCEDSLRPMLKASAEHGISLPDRQLCCAPLGSEVARHYLRAMACAANYAWVNRQVMRGLVERVVERTFGRDPEMRLIYDVCHNIGKFEEHGGRRLFVHRKGATRAFPPGHPLLPERIRSLGQPVFVPGDMGRASFLLIGAAGSMEKTWGSTCHGAGRQYSRTEMKRRTAGRDLFAEMRDRHGVVVMARGRDAVADEMPEAYKDASQVVEVMERAGISEKVVRLRPIACIKG